MMPELSASKEGFVSLVGAGPGDPGLLTRLGWQRLQQADVVLYDHLVHGTIRTEIPAHVETLYAGKWAGNRAMTQDEIIQAMVVRAQAGQRVVRLKGGDPFLFGRGGEEASVLAEKGIPYEVIPGVSSAIAVPAYAGIPVTDRRVASSVLITTGHLDPREEQERERLKRLAVASDTLVVLMGTRNLGGICEAIILGGKPPSTPAAVIQWGCTGQQKTVRGTLETLEERAHQAAIGAPSTLVIGEVVSTGEGLDWFEKRPLLGKKILVTRAGQPGEKLSQMAVELGADVYACPTIAIVPPESYEPLDAALSQLSDYDWVLFTSANSILPVRERLRALGTDVRALAGCRIGVVGESTAAALREHGLEPDLIPGAFHGEGLLEALREQGTLSGQRFLLPRALSAREVLPQGIRDEGGRVDVVTAYQTVVPESLDLPRLKAWFSEEGVHVVTLMSSSAGRNLVSVLGGSEEAGAIMDGSVFASISEITAATMRELGFDSDIVAEVHTSRGLLSALESWATAEEG